LVTYWVYSILILARGKCEIAANASFDLRRVLGHGDLEQESTTLTGK